MSEATRGEICAVACADAFRGNGEILASCFGTAPAIGARLAKATFEPDLLMTDGVCTVVDNPSPVSGPGNDLVVEAWLPFRAIFDHLWNGNRHVIMAASQIDQFGNQNFACIGEHAKPKAQLLGMRGAPGNTIFRTIDDQLRPKLCPIRTKVLSTLSTAPYVATTVGVNVPSAISAYFDASSMPNQITNKGSSAIFGIGKIEATSGTRPALT